MVKKSSVFIAGHQKEYRWLMLKSPKLHDGFQGKTFKDRVRERVAWYMINLWTLF